MKELSHEFLDGYYCYWDDDVKTYNSKLPMCFNPQFHAGYLAANWEVMTGMYQYPKWQCNNLYFAIDFSGDNHECQVLDLQ